MSYEILKYVSFNKKENIITVTSASNNCSPRTYGKSVYSVKDMSFEQNIEYFFVDMLNGNIQGGQKKVRDIYEALRQLKKCFAPNTSFDTDLELKVGRDNGLDHLVSKLYAVPAIMTGTAVISQGIIDAIKRYDGESVRIYAETRKEYADKGWLITGACSRSDIFPGYNIWCLRDGTGYVVGEHSCYEQAQLGFCNTKAGKTILVPADMKNLNIFHMLSCGFTTSFDEMSESQKALVADPTLWKLFEGMEVDRLPCPGFPLEQFGLKRKEVAA